MQVGQIGRTHKGLAYKNHRGDIVPLNYGKDTQSVVTEWLDQKLPLVSDGLDNAVEFLRSCFVEALTKRGEKYDVSRFAYLEENGKYYEPSICFGPCHARLNAPDKGIAALLTSPNVAVWPTWNQGSGSRDAYGRDEFDRETIDRESREYWAWLVCDSPWAGCFVEKYDPDLSAAVGVRMDVHAPGNLVCQALTATRVPHEYPGRVRFWSRMKARGACPVASLVLSEFVQARLVPDVMMKYRGDGGNIHDMFPESLPLDVVTRIKKLAMVSTTQPMVDRCAFGGVHAAWGRVDKLIGPMVRDALVDDEEKPAQYEWKWRHLAMEKVEEAPGYIAYDKGIDRMVEVANRLAEVSA